MTINCETGNIMTLEAIILSFLASLLATLLGILIVLYMERQRRPHLMFSNGDSLVIPPNDPLGRQACKWLRINVKNQKPNGLINRLINFFYGGEPAILCLAWIDFFNIDGEKLFDSEMFARWSENPHPLWKPIEAPKGVDWNLLELNKTIDIPSGEHVLLDVAFKAAGEADAFGFNTESYPHNWRNPNWKLKEGKYQVKIRVKTNGREFTDIFILTNESSLDNFNLESAQENHKHIIAKSKI